MTFEALDKEARHYKTPHAVQCLLDSARQNADDTLYTEKACTPEEHDGIALSSLELLLGDETDRKVTNWFKKRGVRW